MFDDGLHHHIENCGVQGVSLGYTAVSIEGGDTITLDLYHHRGLDPVHPENPEHPRAHSIFHHNIERQVPVQGALRLLEVQEYITENILPRGLYMLDQLGLKEAVPIPCTARKP